MVRTSIYGMGIGLVIGMQGLVALAAPGTAGIAWRPDWSTAQAEAKQTHKLVMVDFYTDWCPFCKVMDSDVYPETGVVKAAAQFVPVRVNAETEGRQLAERYGVESFPTVLFTDEAGNALNELGGFEPAKQFTADLDRIAESYHQFPVLQAHVKAHPEDTAAGVKLATGLIQRQQIEQARTLIDSLQARGDRALLAPVYAGMGDYYLKQHQAAAAAPWYQKVLNASRDSRYVALARLKLGLAEVIQGKVSAGKTELQAVLAMQDAPSNIKQGAQDLLQLVREKHLG